MGLVRDGCGTESVDTLFEINCILSGINMFFEVTVIYRDIDVCTAAFVKIFSKNLIQKSFLYLYFRLGDNLKRIFL